MNRSPLRSTPPPTPSPYRYLGRGGGERPVRIQIIMALVATLVLVAVPLYLWRRPQPESIPSADAAVADAGAPRLPTAPMPFTADGGVTGQVAPDGALVPPGTPLPQAAPKLEIAPIKTLKCQDPGPGRTPPERCDGIRAFEDALTRAIRDSQSCAPPSRSSFVMSYVLEMNFAKKHQTLFLGKSTTLSRSRRKDLLKCVERALPAPDWDRIPHQHMKYTLDAVVTYPPAAATPEAQAPDAEALPSAGGAAPPHAAPGAGGPAAPKAAPKPRSGAGGSKPHVVKPAKPAPKKAAPKPAHPSRPK
jgi:hypothetical protein